MQLYPIGDTLVLLDRMINLGNLGINDLKKDLIDNPLLTYQTFGGFVNRLGPTKCETMAYFKREMHFKKLLFTKNADKLSLHICFYAQVIFPSLSTTVDGVRTGYPIFLIGAKNLSNGRKLEDHVHQNVVEFFKNIEIGQECELYLLVQDESDLDQMREWSPFKSISDN